MMTILKPIFLPIFILSIVGMKECKIRECVDIPSIDNTSPSVTLSVFFTDASHKNVSFTVDTRDNNSPLTVDVPRANKFTLAYASSDDGGVMHTLLIYKATIDNGDGTSQIVQPLLTPKTYSGCPKGSRLESENYKGGETKPTIYEFQALAADYKNNEGQTPKMTIRHQ